MSKTESRLNSERRKLAKMERSFESSQSKGRLDASQIEKEQIKLSKQRLKVTKLESDLSKYSNQLLKAQKR